MTYSAGRAATPRLFGTNGVRGIVNSRDMDPMFAVRLGLAIGTFMRGPVMVGTDARTSKDMISSACISGLMASGCDVMDCGVLPTPALQYAVKTNRVSGGVMITASHNPPEFNGIKCIDSDGTEMSQENEQTIERIYYTGEFRRAGWSKVGRVVRNLTAIERYLDGIVSSIDVEAVRGANLHVAVDCGNGAASFVTPLLLERLGVRYVSLNADPNGAFPGHNSEPTPENVKDLVELVRSGSYDLGFVHDGDADRTIFVDERGRYLYGDRSLAIVAHSMCMSRKGGLVVTTVGSSSAVEDAVQMAGGHVIYTRVGSPVVARVMMQKGGIFGGEENGGLIFADFQYCRDGAMAAAKILEIVATEKMRLSALNDRIPAYSQFKAKTPCPEEKRESVMTSLAAAAEGKKVDRTDGIKIFLSDGWVLVRPSGTEPIIRIFTESRTQQKAAQLADEYKQAVERLVRG